MENIKLWVGIFYLFKENYFAPQGSIYFINNIVETVILWNIIEILNNCFNAFYLFVYLYVNVLLL